MKGWRLPTRIEMMTLLSFDEIHAFEATAFDAKSYDNLPLWHASDDPSRNAYYEGHYHIHTFRPNLVGTWFSAGTPCVKAPYPVTDHAQAPDASRFSLTGSVLTDNVTSLAWFTKVDGAARQYTDATTYCANLAASDPAAAPATAKPWRLPTLKEARSTTRTRAGDFYWDVSDFASTACVRDAKK